MKTGKLLRIAGLAGVTLLVLGGIGAALGGGSSAPHDTPTASVDETYLGDDGFGADNDVMAGIDKALGRPSTQPQSQNANGVLVPPVAPDVAKGAAADSTRSSVAGAPPVAPAPSGASEAYSTAGGAGSGPTGDTSATIDDRKIVQTAALKLQVKEVGGAFEDVGRIASSAGGFIASSNFALQGDQQVAALTVRVPATRYQDVLSQVRALGVKVDSETSNASDVTEEYSDLAARQRNLEATETQLLSLLGQAQSISDVLQVQDRLNSVRTQIDQVKGRIALLDKLSDLATLTVQLRPVAAASGETHAGGTDFGAKVDAAWDDSLDFLASIAGGVITVVVFGWWVPLVGLPLWLIVSRLRNRPRPISAVD